MGISNNGELFAKQVQKCYFYCGVILHLAYTATFGGIPLTQSQSNQKLNEIDCQEADHCLWAMYKHRQGVEAGAITC